MSPRRRLGRSGGPGSAELAPEPEPEPDPNPPGSDWSRARAQEAQHAKVLSMFEQWNDVLVTAKERFGAKNVLTPHTL